jgi:hypothetical protein
VSKQTPNAQRPTPNAQWQNREKAGSNCDKNGSFWSVSGFNQLETPYIMNAKQIPLLSIVAALTLSGSVAMAAGHGGSAGSGGGRSSGGGFRGGAAPARNSPGFARPTSRFGPGASRNFRRHRDRDFDDDFFFFGGFYDPFFYPYYGYYPYPYGYSPYGYGYGYNPYYQSGYGGVAGGVSVREIQVRLTRAGFYHGRIDGVMGPKTRLAIRAYKRSHGLRTAAR